MVVPFWASSRHTRPGTRPQFLHTAVDVNRVQTLTTVVFPRALLVRASSTTSLDARRRTVPSAQNPVRVNLADTRGSSTGFRTWRSSEIANRSSESALGRVGGSAARTSGFEVRANVASIGAYDVDKDGHVRL